jgi:hypothetical protein
MRVILRHSLAGFYYAGPTCWVNGSNRALDLNTVEQAVEIARKEKLGRMEIVACFDVPSRELVFPIHFNGSTHHRVQPHGAPTDVRAAA